MEHEYNKTTKSKRPKIPWKEILILWSRGHLSNFTVHRNENVYKAPIHSPFFFAPKIILVIEMFPNTDLTILNLTMIIVSL
jgi:hypothetical protein